MSGVGFFYRLRSLFLALLALMYYLVARTLASHAANGLSSGAWFDVVDYAALLFLVVLGYAAMALVFQWRRAHNAIQTPILNTMGLVARPWWHREFGIGAALGWGMMIACILPIALAGGLVVTFWPTSRQFGFMAFNLIALALLTLVQEIVFRGYVFQRLIEALGSTLGTIFLLFVVASLYAYETEWTINSMMVALLFALLLCVAYLRTRAIWLGWGFHFAWTATMAVLFGLPVRGSSQFSSVIQSDARGSFVLTGGSYGPEGGFLAVIALIGGIIVAVRVTRAYAWEYAQPVIVAGGMPVDLDRAQQQQHELASADLSAHATLQGGLVQIAPVTSVSPVALESSAPVPAKTSVLEGTASPERD